MTSHASDNAPERAPSADDRLFFAERLPAGADSESPAETESRVLLDIETGSPLPVDRLAYGWIRLPSKEILYYAAPRERVPEHDAFASAGTVVPPPASVVLPEGVSEADFAKASRDFYSDLRPRAELAEMRIRAAADSLLSKIGLPLKLVALTCVLLLLGTGVVSALNAVETRKLAAAADGIKEAQTRADMLSTIDRMEAAGHSVFDALAVVNPARPEGVSFKKVIFSANRELALDGVAPNASAATRMDDSLRATGFFSSSDQPKIGISGGGATFHMRLIFNKWPVISDTPSSMTAAAAAESASTSPTEISAPADGSASGSGSFGERGSRRRGQGQNPGGRTRQPRSTQGAVQ